MSDDKHERAINEAHEAAIRADERRRVGDELLRTVVDPEGIWSDPYSTIRERAVEVRRICRLEADDE